MNSQLKRRLCALFLAALTPAVCGNAVASCVANAAADTQTTYSGTVPFVPEWARSAIWYQVFPERFRNGDPSNDPTVDDIRGADPQEQPAYWNIHPWGSDWYALQPYETANGEPELWKHLLRRRYGGDLQGVIDKLDYIASLGINAIYLNPVFDAPSLHKYDGASFHHIDPNFGPDPEGDRRLMASEKPFDPSTWVWTRADELALELIEQAHARGIRIIFDGVFNHMGINSFAFRDVQERQQASPYRDWFTILSWDDPSAGTQFSYQGWFGVPSLPEFAEDENGLAQGPRDYVFAATERWMNPKGKGTAYGIDGWRLDVAFCVAHPFWKAWRRHVKQINPEAYLTAELVLPVAEVQPYLQGDEFDGEMNYNFAFASEEFFFQPGEYAITATQFDKALAEMRDRYPEGVAYVTQNLFGSHDSNRVGSHIVNRGLGQFRDWGRYFEASKAAENPAYDVRKPNDEERRLQKLFAIFQMTYVGAPMIYYGDEVGMWGANDPDDRKPMIWPDIAYEDERTNADGGARAPDSVDVDRSLQDHYRRLIWLRRQYAPLSLGSFQTLIADDDRELFAFAREHEGTRLVVVLNNADRAQRVEMPVSGNTELVDLLSGLPVEVAEESASVKVPRRWGAILLERHSDP